MDLQATKWKALQWHAMRGSDAAARLKADPKHGLSSAQARRLLEQEGENKLAQKKGKGLVRQFLAQFSDFMVIILLIAAGISFASSWMERNKDFIDPAIILGIVILNAVIGVIQERRAERSLEALKKMSAPAATVVRDGRRSRIPAVKVVRGDVLSVNAGDLVPADARLLESSGLRVQESALTGESAPVGKSAELLLPESAPPAERGNMLFASTTVVAGHGTAVVTGTGMATQVGQIAHLLNEEEAPMTPLQLRLAKVGRALGLGALGLCGLIFLLGLLRGADLLDSFLLSVSLAVAAIPEGLPAIVTVVLSLGVQRMTKNNAIIRHLPAVETLGAATVICSDKTGTLTQNRMRVTEIRTPKGAAASPAEERRILTLAALCCNASLGDKSRRAQGDPTESAILLAADGRMDLRELRKSHPRLSENPFASERKMMSTLHKSPQGYLLAVKGAPDVLLRLCGQVLLSGSAMELTENLRKNILAQNEKMAAEALRVLGVAYRETASSSDTAENRLVFCGLLGLQDPPRKEVYAAVRTCKEAGIVPVMITGDHALTASAIARQLGILDAGAIHESPSSACVTGQELDALSQEALTARIASCRVFARVTPEHKVRIVKAYRAQGEVVAMTGDGVNDSPALKAADIGCAMGKSGTEVAKSAADMVLTDDNFATIVKAVAEGRGIYDNIRKAVHFLLSCNIGEILSILAASLLALPTPLLPIQLLWVNLVTDSLPAMALGTEQIESDIMQRRPVPPGAGFFSNGLWLDIALEGLMVGGLALLAFLLGCSYFGTLEIGRTMCFAVLSLSELVHALNMRSTHSVFRIGLFSNKKLSLSILICVLLQVSVITVPMLAPIFDTVALDGPQWAAVTGLSLAPLAFVEAGKLFSNSNKKLKKKKGGH